VLVTTGVGSRYDPGVFERTVAVRQRYGSLPEGLDWEGGYIALLEPDLIGQKVLACSEVACRWVMVVDCAGHADGGYAWMVRNRIAGELDPETAALLDAVGNRLDIYLAEPTYLFR
jgi:hypothetical protein